VAGQDDAFALGAKAATTASAALFGRLYTILVAGIAFILVARLLGPTSYGVYSVAMAVVGFFTAVGGSSIGASFSKFIGEYSSVHNKRKIAELLVNGYLILVIVCVLLTMLAFALSGFLASYVLHNSAYTYVLEYASVIIIISVLFNDSYSALAGFGLGRSMSLGVAIQITVQSIISVALAFSGYGALAPILGLILSYAVGTAFIVRTISKRVSFAGVRVSIKVMKHILGFALPIAASNIITSISSNLTIIVLGIFVTTAVVGDFGVVQRTNTLISTISDSIGVSLLPLFAAGLAQQRYNPRKSSAFYSYAVYVAFLFITPIMLYTVLLATPFTVTVFNGVYAHASLYLAVMSVGVLVGIAGAYAPSLLMSANKVMLVVKCYALIALVQLAFLAVLVPTFKGIGAVVQMFIVTPIATTLIFVYAARKALNARLDLGKILRVVLAGLISAAFILPLLYLVGTNYIVLLVVAVVEQALLYPPILAITSAATRKDLRILKRVSGGTPVVGVIMGTLADYSLMFCPVSRTET
jgi:O-antigen/teichoic acid export membrane protein